MFKIDCLTFSRQIFRATTTGDGAHEAGSNSGKKTAQETQEEIERLQTVLGWAEQMDANLDITPTINEIQILQAQGDETLDQSL